MHHYMILHFFLFIYICMYISSYTYYTHIWHEFFFFFFQCLHIFLNWLTQLLLFLSLISKIWNFFLAEMCHKNVCIKNTEYWLWKYQLFYVIFSGQLSKYMIILILMDKVSVFFSSMTIFQNMIFPHPPFKWSRDEIRMK